MELTLHRRKQLSHPKLGIRWPRLRPDRIEEIARANRIQKELERRKHLSLRRNLTNSVLNSYIV